MASPETGQTAETVLPERLMFIPETDEETAKKWMTAFQTNVLPLYPLILPHNVDLLFGRYVDGTTTPEERLLLSLILKLGEWTSGLSPEAGLAEHGTEAKQLDKNRRWAYDLLLDINMRDISTLTDLRSVILLDLLSKWMTLPIRGNHLQNTWRSLLHLLHAEIMQPYNAEAACTIWTFICLLFERPYTLQFLDVLAPLCKLWPPDPVFCRDQFGTDLLCMRVALSLNIVQIYLVAPRSLGHLLNMLQTHRLPQTIFETEQQLHRIDKWTIVQRLTAELFFVRRIQNESQIFPSQYLEAKHHESRVLELCLKAMQNLEPLDRARTVDEEHELLVRLGQSCSKGFTEFRNWISFCGKFRAFLQTTERHPGAYEYHHSILQACERRIGHNNP